MLMMVAERLDPAAMPLPSGKPLRGII